MSTGLAVRIQFLAITLDDNAEVVRETTIEDAETFISGSDYSHERAAAFYSELEDLLNKENPT